jgi:NADH-quinone oxidoreductase subunit D
MFLEEFPVAGKNSKTYLRNRIFMDRTINVGVLLKQVWPYGFTGPNLRAAGVDYDVRVAQPYSSMKILIYKFLLENQEILTIVFVFVMLRFGKVEYHVKFGKMPEGNEFHADKTPIITFRQKKMFTLIWSQSITSKL